MRLGAKYKVRLMADESLSWGVLGENGRGVTEHYNLPVSAIDVIIGSLAASLGSVGGFCVGKCVTTLQLPLPMRPSPTTALPLQPRGHRPPAPCRGFAVLQKEISDRIPHNPHKSRKGTAIPLAMSRLHNIACYS